MKTATESEPVTGPPDHAGYIDRATYSPEDNKLRLYPSARLPRELYEKVRAAGFVWAPRQEIFVAPMWTPDRADFAERLAGELTDEDTSLVERAEERAERFEDYSENRRKDADRAHAAVAAIADNIPLGQPILVGHHSERHARRDAEKIENGMRRAIKMWETSKYWTDRAAGAIGHAKYKELPGVRARRIKGLESDARKMRERLEYAERRLKAWQHEPMTRELALGLANHSGGMDLWSDLNSGRVSVEETVARAVRGHAATLAEGSDTRRWLAHIENRLAYERAMLAEGGGLVGERFDIQPGGQVKRRGSWFVVRKANRRDGAIISVSVIGHWAGTVQIEDVQDYRPPAEGDGAKVEAATKLPPLCNYPGEGFQHMTTEEHKKHRWSDRSYTEVVPGTEQAVAHRVRTHNGKNFRMVRVYLTDAPTKLPPPPGPRKEIPKAAPSERWSHQPPKPDAEAAKFEGLKETLRAGVQVVNAPQLFPTPPQLAGRLVMLAGVSPGMVVLEPSAGTGNLIRPIISQLGGLDCGRIVTIEVNSQLCEGLNEQRKGWLYANDHTWRICPGDFLTMDPGTLGTFHRVVMNPPFERGADIEHIRHALRFLKPGGKLAAICANGPRQREAFMDIAEHWEDLPAGSFKDSGTNVNAAIVVLSATA